MKILYIHQYFNTPLMSGGTRSYEMAKRLVAAGHDVVMLTSIRNETKRGVGWEITFEDGIEVHWCNVHYSNEMGFLRRLWSFLVFTVVSIIHAMRFTPDIVFATSTPLTVGVSGVLISKIKKCPMVFEVRDLWPEMPIAVGALKNPIAINLAHRMERWIYKNSEAIVALSAGMADGIISTGVPAESVAVIPNSADIGFFRNHENMLSVSRDHEMCWNDGAPILMYIGTFGKLNGVSYLVRLADKLRQIGSNIKIVAIGGGKDWVAVEALSKELGVLNRNFFMEPRIKKINVPAMMQHATVCCSLFVDLFEMQKNSANKFFDALAAQKPIMINYGGWMAEIITENDCGIVLGATPTTELASLLHHKMNDRDWCLKASIAAGDAAHMFDRDKLAEKLEKVLSHAQQGDGSSVSKIASYSMSDTP